MNRSAVVVATAAAAVAVFALAGTMYSRNSTPPASRPAAVESTNLVRPHSPVIGPPTAPVTIVEFLDPSCETCRAFYPIVKQIMAKHPNDVRLVLRYAPFHQGSDEAVKILETARLQNVFEPVLEALFAKQPEWAVHGAPNLSRAWDIAKAAGLDIDRARKDAKLPVHDDVLKQDIADIKEIKLNRTPTFFVNGKPLPSFGPDELAALVNSEVQNIKSSARD
jgi:protein-disulfide isomerase